MAQKIDTRLKVLEDLLSETFEVPFYCFAPEGEDPVYLNLVTSKPYKELPSYGVVIKTLAVSYDAL